MTARAEEIEKQIRELPLKEMLMLHENLVASIQMKEELLDPEYRAEIERRIAEIESGRASGTDGFEALRGM